MSRDITRPDELASLIQLQDRLQTQQDELFRKQQELQFRETYAGTGSTKSFTQGLIIGQLSVIILLGIFIKFFVFADSSTTSSTSGNGISSKTDVSNILVKRKKNGDGDAGSEGRSDEVDTILEKTYYDVDNHAPESLDWFNVLIAQTISLFRYEALQSDNIYHSLKEFLSKLELPDS